jgi:hypothetical protein
MTLAEQTFVDARKWQAHERRCALVHFDDLAVMLTASWMEPTGLSVRRPDGAFRKEYLVHLTVPSEHQLRTFEEARLVELCLSDARHPLTSTDLVVLSVRDGVVTMSLFVDDWN